MSLAFLILILVFVVLPLGTMWILTRNAPLGWEDRNGFHFAEEPVTEEEHLELRGQIENLVKEASCQTCGAALPYGWVLHCRSCIENNFERLDEYRGLPGLVQPFPECSTHRVKRGPSKLP